MEEIAEKLNKEEGDIKLAVIGSPGHGKSTFLSAMVAESEQSNNPLYDFETGAGVESCTKVVKARTVDFKLRLEVGDKIEVCDDDEAPEEEKEWRSGTIDHMYVTGNVDVIFDDDGTKEEDVEKKTIRAVGKANTVKLTIVDTMGFPDPNPKDTVKFYEDVVKDAVNRPGGLHALVWVLKQDRENEKIYKMYTAFMNELGAANCKLIMIINGTENIAANSKMKTALKKCKTPKEKEECMRQKREEIKGTLTATAQKLIDVLTFTQSVDAIISTDLEVFENATIHELVNVVKTLELKTSKVRTFTELQADFDNATKSLENYKKDLTVKIGSVQRELNAEKARRDKEKADFEREMREAKAKHAEEVARVEAKHKKAYNNLWWWEKASYVFIGGYPEPNLPHLDMPVQKMSDAQLKAKIDEANAKLAKVEKAGKEETEMYQKEADKKREAVARLADALNFSTADTTKKEGYTQS